ncbi:family 43 glycosylhydrolase [Streptomyces sp. NPDC006393]|uniref:family 43 glycosylhydrolase n=1 Tax=Streptomyces sp. NPDC006393 TaxID=3156763 RepID=UPI0033CEA347
MSTGPQKGTPVGRRALLAGVARTAGAAGAVGLAGAAGSLGAVARAAAAVPASGAASGRHPSNWPDLEPYGLADTRTDLWPRRDNSFVLPLELRPRDEELGRVWMRDTYVNCFRIAGRRPLYVATGTTRVPGLDTAGPWNDGIFVWTAASLRGPWRLADTTGVRPGAEKGKVWSPEFADENRPGRTVVAPWQQYWYDDRFGRRGNVWAPEVHYFRDTWYIVACMGDRAHKVGSFLLVSEGGVEGPYRLAEGNLDKPFGDALPDAPYIDPGARFHIDGSMYTEGDDAWLVLHNNVYARFRDDMEDIVPTTRLPAFRQQPYTPEPYLEGAYVFKHGGKYYLLHAAWDRTSTAADGSTRHAYDTPAPGRTQYQYDAIVAVADHFEGPYSRRWTLGVGAGHNNIFADVDGGLWATFFRNPNFGHWADPARIAEAAVPGVVRLEWTGPQGNRLYVRRQNRGHAISE